MRIQAFVQARMSSRRFPGKVLAPFRGEPVIRHVLRAVERVVSPRAVTVVTSDEASDDPLVAYLSALGVHTFRGPRDDVLERFRRCVQAHPATWILRICADSPLLDPAVLRAVLAHAASAELDLVTTTFPRTFPKGRNAELIRARTLLALPADGLDAEDREHVTRFFYRHAERFAIARVTSGDAAQADRSYAIDTVEDLERLEREAPPMPPPPPAEVEARTRPRRAAVRRAVHAGSGS